MKKRLTEVMKRAVKECGQIMCDRVGTVTVSDKTSSRDVVTQYDKAVQSALMARLLEAFPTAGFLAEEAEQTIAGDPMFIIDPIDGTMNFVKGYYRSCISVGCLWEGKPVAAVIYDPYHDELFSATAGCGAFLNDMPIHVTEAPLAENLVIFGTSPYYLEAADRTFDILRSLYSRCLDIRRTGSAALDLCYVACGRAGLFFEVQLSVWDFAAGALILQEAGARVTDMEGNPLPLDGRKSSVLAGSALTVQESGIVDTQENVG